MAAQNEPKTAVITGATSGFGRAAADYLAQRGFELYLVCRDATRGERVAREIEAHAGSLPRLAIADLSAIAEVRRVGDEIRAADRPLHLLLNNAGAVYGMARRESADGLEATFALNHLAYFQLTALLIERLKDAAPSRVINVASNAYEYAGGRFNFDDYNARQNYRPHRQYGASKLANILFTHELARRLQGTGVRAIAWSPAGLTATRFAYGAHWLAPLIMKLTHPFALSTQDAVRPLLKLCCGDLAPELDGRFVFGEELRHVEACNHEDAERLWALSAELTDIP